MTTEPEVPLSAEEIVNDAVALNHVCGAMCASPRESRAFWHDRLRRFHATIAARDAEIAEMHEGMYSLLTWVGLSMYPAREWRAALTFLLATDPHQRQLDTMTVILDARHREIEALQSHLRDAEVMINNLRSMAYTARAACSERIFGVEEYAKAARRQITAALQSAQKENDPK